MQMPLANNSSVRIATTNLHQNRGARSRIVFTLAIACLSFFSHFAVLDQFHFPLAPNRAVAQEVPQEIPGAAAALSVLRIVDCQGFTRAVQQVDPGQVSRVEVSVPSHPDTPTEVQLSNVGNNFSQVAMTNNGMAVFSNVPPGTFEIAVAGTGAELGAIAVGTVAFEAGVTTAVGIASGIVAGGAVTGAVIGTTEIVDSGGSSGSSPPPVPTRPPSTPAPTPAPPADCAVCDPDAEPPALDQEDFFPEAQTLKLSPST